MDSRLGTVFAMAQTPDGYLWLGSQFGVFRFDGVRFIPWEPPAGQRLPDKPYSLIVTRDGAVWIGTFCGPRKLERRQAHPLSGTRWAVRDLAVRRP